MKNMSKLLCSLTISLSRHYGSRIIEIIASTANSNLLHCSIELFWFFSLLKDWSAVVALGVCYLALSLLSCCLCKQRPINSFGLLNA